MNIVYLDWNAFCQEGAIKAMEDAGHKVYMWIHDDYQSRQSDSFLAAFARYINGKSIDMVFSFNYYPVMAEACKQNGIKYVSFTFDNPYVMLYSYTLMYPTNYVFLFDRMQCDEFRRGGLNNVYYMVLPCYPNLADDLLAKPYKKSRVVSDVSFVGELYNEEHNFYDRLTAAGDQYLNGYLEGLIEAQLKVQGYNFVEEAITPDIYKRLYQAEPYDSQSPGVESNTFAYANYFINRKATSVERIRMLTALGSKFPNRVKLYTWNPDVKLPGVQNMGIAVYETEMPLVFNQSKINLNITLRSIKSGIPLRCMDIMGSHGFLLSNYQQDLVDAFVPNEDFIYYESQEDMLEKVDYFLAHDAERREIAENGYRRAASEYNYDKVFERIFEIVAHDHAENMYM